ncbi:hypothetical protein CERSUDRAFT_116481 [Gelatoporia subvermispora B]|uniref:Uncharacterized protein n=1 Tax=Ceriporiopsis subvermispora (strain B) TaxID=914234 RepID=M2R8F1_CERS8|nr:hypothetical protein CERSUDRAFT_116481 [Gelatoporia subvermispora B]
MVIHIVIFSMCTYYIIQENKASNAKWFALVCALFASGTINICMNIHFNELTWIDERNYPGGPLAFLLEQQSVWTNTLGNSASLVATFLADGLLIYRVYAVWRRWYIVVVPILTWLASTVLSVLSTFQAALPNSSLWANNTLDFSVPFWSLSMSLNILLTILLVTRLLYMRRRIIATLGRQYGQMYTGIAAMIVESALPYALVSFIFVVLYGLNNTAANLFIPLVSQVQCIAPMLVILRVTRGRAWSYDTASEANITDLRCGTGSGSSGSSSGKTGSATAARSHGTELSRISFKAGSNPHLQSYDDAV